MNVKAVTNAANVTGTKEKGTKSSGNSFKSYLGESEELDAIFQKASKKYGVDVNLLKAIAKAESDFNPNCTSHCGAMGIMQLMPGTAKGLGVKDAYDPEQNIMGGAKLISNLLDKYDGDLSLALAGYNAGTGNVRKYGGVPPFKETQNYIKKVNKYLSSGSKTGATVLTYNTTKPTTTPAAESSTSKAALNQTVIPSGLQLKRMAEESASVSTASASGSILQNVGLSSTDQITSMLRRLEANGEVQDTNDVFAYEDYLKFVDLFYVQDEEEASTSSTQSDAERARIQMTASITGMLKSL